MELLGDVRVEEDSFGKRIDESEFYKPVMTNSEMLRMEDITSPYKAIPKIYSENIIGSPGKNINNNNATSSLTIYKVVNNYLKVKKPRHSKMNSWSGASTRRSRQTSDTARTTPQQGKLKQKMDEIYKEIIR